MKILCPVDFSQNSLNAAIWASAFLKDLDPNGEVKFLHCANIRRRAEMFLKIDHILRQNAESDFNAMIHKLGQDFPSLKYEYEIQVADPKTFIPKYADEQAFDLIIIGSKGLTSLKNLLVGSVANTIMKNTSIPTLIIPVESTYRPIRHIVVGVDNDLTHLKKDLQPIQSIFLNPEETSLYLVHVTQKGDLIDKYNLKPTVDLGPVKTQYTTIDLDDSIGESLMDYCEDENADLLIMIHEQRNWLEKLFRKNLSKKGLFELDLPFLVLQEQEHDY